MYLTNINCIYKKNFINIISPSKYTHPEIIENNIAIDYLISNSPKTIQCDSVPNNIILDENNIKICKNDLYYLRPIILPDNSQYKNIEYIGYNSDIIDILDGLIIPKNIGKTIVIARIKNTNIYDYCNIEIIEEKIDTIEYINYDLNESDFNISIDGKNATKTREGLNNAFLYCINNGYNKITLKHGIYLIDYEGLSIPSNLFIDLNDSTIKLEPHDVNKTAMINLNDVNNISIKNGIIYGDKGKHVTSTHEFVHGFNISGDTHNINIENINIKNIQGYGVAISSGKRINIKGITRENLEFGSYNKGTKIYGNSYDCRTAEPLDIETLKSYELGFPFGYSGYPYISSRIMYDIEFYDKDMNFINKYIYKTPYKKYIKPLNAKYCNIVFHNTYWLNDTGYQDYWNSIIFLTEHDFTSNLKFNNCIFEDCLALAIASSSGGTGNIISNCID